MSNEHDKQGGESAEEALRNIVEGSQRFRDEVYRSKPESGACGVGVTRPGLGQQANGAVGTCYHFSVASCVTRSRSDSTFRPGCGSSIFELIAEWPAGAGDRSAN
ncbi:hypothetical protein D9M71_819620 [compost metagenome]